MNKTRHIAVVLNLDEATDSEWLREMLNEHRAPGGAFVVAVVNTEDDYTATRAALGI